MRKLLIVSLILILSRVGNTLTIIPPRPVYPDDEIIWFDVSDSFLVTCQADGIVCRWDINTGKPISHFRVNEYVRIYEYGNPSGQQLFVSYTGRPLLAFFDRSSSPAVRFYDLLTGEQTKTIKIKERAELFGHGFGKDGRLFFYSSSGEQVVLCLETQTGKTRRRSEYAGLSEYLGTPLMQRNICNNGASYVNFSPYRVVARDSTGKLLWRRKEKAPGWIELSCHQPVGPSDVVLVWKDGYYIVAAMSLTDGSILWEKHVNGYDDLWATTTDRKKQAFCIDGVLQISNLPNKDVVTVSEIKHQCDAVFTQNGKYLLCLPVLEKVGEDKKANTCTFERRSRVLKVVNCEAGKVIRQLNLEKP